MHLTKLMVGSILLGSIFMAGGAHAVPMASLTLLDPNVVVGENFQVRVEVSGDGIDQALLGFGFNVIPDTFLFSYAGYTLGSGFTDISDPLSPLNVTGAAFPAIDTDSALLAILSFASLAEGTGTLEVVGENTDCAFCGLFYEVDTFEVAGSIDIVSSTSVAVDPIPEPSTWVLMGGGFLGLVAAVRKRKKA